MTHDLVLKVKVMGPNASGTISLNMLMFKISIDFQDSEDIQGQ